MSSMKWRCPECGWRGDTTELLRAPNPFDAGQIILGCPGCKEAPQFVNTCDEPGCEKDVSCGWSSPAGYRHTCHDHYNFA